MVSLLAGATFSKRAEGMVGVRRYFAKRVEMSVRGSVLQFVSFLQFSSFNHFSLEKYLLFEHFALF